MDNIRVIVSGGGTGGHIFPALSIADAVKAKCPDAKILFVGAENRMEMQRVPAAGYEIVGLPVSGFDRKHLLKNVAVLWRLMKSRRKARRVIRDFKPHVAVGVGGYASGPTLKEAGNMGIPTLLQEQNSFAGVTNKLLAKQAACICVAYEGMERFFPKEKIKLTGNPVRQNLLDAAISHVEALTGYGFVPEKKTVLVMGGSLGARTLNESMLASWEAIGESGVQFIWQTGKYYYKDVCAQLSGRELPNVHVCDFIANMDAAYAAADLVISRAGAGSISEFCLLGKAVLLVPSPNVSEDHQTKNAMALVDKGAALYVKDADAVRDLVPLVLDTVKDEARLAELSAHIRTLALPRSAEVIADEVIALARSYAAR
ncbi:MAG: undecaprenyldiphospho-muramoylpentapeptide beta-N-acetylglucosaminyltransferase [Bacteroidaceae bacterium]|nr:undecaprenyldiphospho-muramoylpentapeptide beta-N-acetylglucosaminyltransferase [Bacteroidaceae bacterium]